MTSTTWQQSNKTNKFRKKKHILVSSLIRFKWHKPNNFHEILFQNVTKFWLVYRITWHRPFLLEPLPFQPSEKKTVTVMWKNKSFKTVDEWRFLRAFNVFISQLFMGTCFNTVHTFNKCFTYPSHYTYYTVHIHVYSYCTYMHWFTIHSVDVIVAFI